ncbi:hypothetical protein TrST_g9143 [Triparma strigata]|uniref:Uncharacterized protein n=1 Tax=Triparma strigata TaxID=1606541 RepID=A0A9W7C7Z7_9STRA|nr:hypothetical protein TrST_g9143 [Triparma strigata]
MAASIFSKAIPKSLQKELAWEMSAIATLNLKWWQKLQGGFIAFSIIPALYLLSYFGVGVKTDPQKAWVIWTVGGWGLTSMAFCYFISAMVMLRTSRNERRHNSTLENSHNNERSSRGISVTDIEDGAIVFAVI